MAAAFGSLDKLMNETAEDLTVVPDIGEVTACSISDWFSSVSAIHCDRFDNFKHSFGYGYDDGFSNDHFTAIQTDAICDT